MITSADRTRIFRVVGWCLLWVVVLLASPRWSRAEGPVKMAPPVIPFSAEVTRLLPDRKTRETGRMFVGADGIRSETTRNGEEVVLIYRPASQTVWTLYPKLKSYMERTGVAVSRPPLPDEAESPCRAGKGVLCRQIGTETVQGRAVTHWEIVVRTPEKEVPHAHLWVDPRLQIAIREQYPDGLSVELGTIREGAQPGNLFEIPKDYQKVDTQTEPEKPAGQNR